MRILFLLATLALAGGGTSATAQQHTVRIGMVRALSATPTMIAIEKGYFKEYGINAEVSDVDTTALIPLAQNVVQVMEAGVTAGYFNALEKNFPIIIATDRVASPTSRARSSPPTPPHRSPTTRSAISWRAPASP